MPSANLWTARFRRFWPMLAMAILSLLMWSAVGYDYYGRHLHAVPGEGEIQFSSFAWGLQWAPEGFTKAAALEFAESGVRINVVAPGPIETGMLNRFTGTAEKKAALISGVPMKRIGQPEEVAAAILFLASDKASFITGASLATDGGKLAR